MGAESWTEILGKLTLKTGQSAVKKGSGEGNSKVASGNLKGDVCIDHALSWAPSGKEETGCSCESAGLGRLSVGEES